MRTNRSSRRSGHRREQSSPLLSFLVELKLLRVAYSAESEATISSVLTMVLA